MVSNLFSTEFVDVKGRAEGEEERDRENVRENSGSYKRKEKRVRECVYHVLFLYVLGS